MRIYYDRRYDNLDGHGWNVIPGPGDDSVRFRTQAEAESWALDHGPTVGHPFWNRLPERFQWTAHNVIAHPVSEILWQLGFTRLSDWVHDVTIPDHLPGSGRG